MKTNAVILGLSKTADERRRTHSAPPDISMPGAKSKPKREKTEKYVPRVRHPNEAVPRNGDWKTSTYKTGDGDIIQPPRPGSLHAYTLPSRGYRT